MLLFLLGIVDLLGAIAMVSYAFGEPLFQLQAISAISLVIKGAIFFDDVVSWIDIIAGIGMFLLFWSTMPNLAIAIAIYLGFKGIMSVV